MKIDSNDGIYILMENFKKVFHSGTTSMCGAILKLDSNLNQVFYRYEYGGYSLGYEATFLDAAFTTNHVLLFQRIWSSATINCFYSVKLNIGTGVFVN
jgi:hypothetical protein